MRHILIRRGHLDTETDTQRKDNVKRHRECLVSEDGTFAGEPWVHLRHQIVSR